MLRRFGAFNCKNLFTRFIFNSFGLLLLLFIVTGCDPAVNSQILTAAAAYQRLHTLTKTSSVPPSDVYCGKYDKAIKGPGNCPSNGTNQDGPIPAFEQTEMRGWIVAGPGWSEPDEMVLNLLLDWGWTAEPGIRAINTPEKILETVTPFNVLMFGVDPTDPTAGGRPLIATISGDAWGGPNAAVIHVEGQAWRFSESPPSDWIFSKTHPSGTPTSQFAVDFFRPDADPALDTDIGKGTYVRIVGTQWEDDCHCQQNLPPPLRRYYRQMPLRYLR